LKKLALAFVAIGMFSTSAQAELKIGFINIERIIRESAPAVKAQNRLEKEFSGREQELEKMARQARTLQADIEKNGVTMGESDRQKKERELGNLNRDFQRAQREFREDFNMRRNEELASVQERATKAIGAIAEAEKYDFILQDVIYASPKVDITDRILKALADK
jgi:outer membrane protein